MLENKQRFEFQLRQEIMAAAKLMNQSGARFADFQQSYCNPAFWELQPNGAFMLKAGVAPASAIRDIFYHGVAYAYECAVAMIMIYYKAVLEIFGDARFNELFHNLYLFSWHHDDDLGLVTRKTRTFIPGDVVYFSNPDVHPAHMESIGENAVVLENGLYFGHGIGIQSGPQMIAKLNTLRKPGAKRSAYLMNQATRPNFEYLMQYVNDSYRRQLKKRTIIGKIGENTHFI